MGSVLVKSVTNISQFKVKFNLVGFLSFKLFNNWWKRFTKIEIFIYRNNWVFFRWLGDPETLKTLSKYFLTYIYLILFKVK